MRKPKLILWYFPKKFNCSLFYYSSVLLHIGYFQDLLNFNSTIINFAGLSLGKDCYIFLDSLTCYSNHINFQDVFSHRKEFIAVSIRWDTDSVIVGVITFQQNNPSFKWVVSTASWELLRCSHKKPIKNDTKSVYLIVFMSNWAVAGEKSKDAMDFS